jgi:hypothetical protein
MNLPPEAAKARHGRCGLSRDPALARESFLLTSACRSRRVAVRCAAMDNAARQRGRSRRGQPARDSLHRRPC